MGANQSSAGSDGTEAGRHSQNVKKCYYELLGLDIQASEDEIKKAYRRKALELHPDRNYGNVEETTRLFAEVQAAYSVLSDPQERAWYDAHRNTILKGDEDVTGDRYENNIRVTTAGEILALFPKLSGRIDYSDSVTGFFSILREMFDKLAQEEILAAEYQDLDQPSYPPFGQSGDEFDPTIRSFYAVWTSFATKKTFSWKEVYRYTEAPDRRVRRMMEKENKRFREEGVREFNDAVRSLVAFVKKRDPRFKSKTQNESDRQKALRDAASAQAARSRAANKARTTLDDERPEWARTSQIEDIENFSDDEEQLKDQFECVVCRKTFKSEKQYEAHEKSKKHLKAAQKIRKEMEREHRNLDLADAQFNDLNGSTVPDSSLEQSSLVDSETNGTEGNGTKSDLIDSNQPKSGIDGSSTNNPNIPSISNVDSLTPSTASRASSPYSIETAAQEEADRPFHKSKSKTSGFDKSPNKPAIDNISEQLSNQSLETSDHESPASKVGKPRRKKSRKGVRNASALDNDNASVCPPANSWLIV
ncbi:MAG: hypothetical protein Q9167_000025 [Letrouitia subvulpina]